MIPKLTQDNGFQIERSVLEMVAAQLDSFDVMKLKELEYIKYQKECDSLVVAQGGIIEAHKGLDSNHESQMALLSEIEIAYNAKMKASTEYIGVLEKKNKGSKIRSKIYLIGGGVLTIGLTTALLISLLQ